MPPTLTGSLHPSNKDTLSWFGFVFDFEEKFFTIGMTKELLRMVVIALWFL